jgi:signal transduction histidine kinase
MQSPAERINPDASLLHERCLELARNTPASVVAYPALLAFCSLASPIGHEHSAWMAVLIVASLAAGLARLGLARQILHNPSLADPRWLQRYRLSAMAVGWVWGVFAASTVYLYGSTWASQLAQVVTVGLTSGASSSLISDFKLLRLYVTMMVVPSWPFLLLLHGEQAWAAPVLFVYLLFLLVVARNNSRRYIAGLRAQRLLVQRTAELEAASRAKSEFLAMMSHEIRTPMNAIFGLTELLLESGLEQQQSEWAKTVKSSCESLLEIISGILDLSKIESGRLELESVAFDLRECLDGLVALFAPVAGQRSLPLRVNFESVPSGTWIQGDRSRVRQVIANLLSNALKFTEQGSVKLVVEKLEANGCAWAQVSVQDSGIGIPEGKMDRLFRPFSQVDASTTRRFGGSGLGLAVCRQLSELMRGRVWVVSGSALGGEAPADFTAEGVLPGSTFYFRFPFEKVAAPAFAIAPVPSAEPEVELPCKETRILLAEDNEVNQGLFQTLLERLGYRVDVAGDGLEVLQLCDRASYQVVFMDLQMPDLDGIETTRRLRQRDQRLWIVALTANAFREDRDRCLAVGMNDYLAKPIRRADFVRALATFALSTR